MDDNPNQGTDQLQTYLVGLDFPANKQQVVDHMRQNGASQDIVSKLEGMGDREFQSVEEVNQVLGQGQQE